MGKNLSIKITIFSILLFLVLIPYSLKIDFRQNDDVYYYQEVEKFMKNDFLMNRKVAPTFYLQGFLGMVFSNGFGIKNLPVLTLFVSVLNFVIIFYILHKHIQIKELHAFLISLTIFFSPLFNYMIWGFMTESYFLFFFLLTILFFLKHEETQDYKYLILTNTFITLAFFIRQVAFVLPIGFSAYFFYKKKYKLFLTYACSFLILYFYYEFLFPKTLEMTSKSIFISKIAEPRKLYSMFQGTLVTILSFFMPVIYWATYIYLKDKKRIRILAFLLSAITLYFLLNKIFNAYFLSWQEFPYFENTWERKGYLPRSIHGTKYHFMGIHDLYKFWGTLSNLSYVFLVSLFIFERKFRKQILNVFFIIFGIYIFVTFLMPIYFDRYIAVSIPVFTMGVLYTIKTTYEDFFSGKIFTLALIINLLVLSFLSYQFWNDFILTEKYVYNKATEIISSGVDPHTVVVSTGWNKEYRNVKKYAYLFSYDTFDVNEELANGFELLEKKEINFPLNVYVNPKIYLYKRIYVQEISEQ